MKTEQIQQILAKYASSRNKKIPEEILKKIKKQPKKISKAFFGEERPQHKYYRRVPETRGYRYYYLHPKSGTVIHQREHSDIHNEIQGKLDNLTTHYFNVSDVHLTPVVGNMNSETASVIVNNMKQVLDGYVHTLPGDVYRRMLRWLDNYHNKLSQNTSFDAELLNTISTEAVHKIIFQEVESRKRQLGDHGIRHIIGNIEYKDKLLNAIESEGVRQFTNEERIVTDLIMVNHDIGYTTDENIKTLGKTHKQHSYEFFNGEHHYRDLVGEDIFQFMHDLILTHDSAEMDWEDKPVESSVRLADNLALFYKEKFPALFRYIPQALHKLESLQQAFLDKDEDAVKGIKAGLISDIATSDLDPLLRKDLKKAVDEVFIMTGKFTLGMLAGEISDIKFVDGTMHVTIRHSDYEKRLQQLFNMGQAQFKKLAETYNIPLEQLQTDKAFDFINENGKTPLHVEVKHKFEKSKLPKAIR